MRVKKAGLKTVRVEIRAQINPTEEKDLVLIAVRNIVDLNKSYFDKSNEELLVFVSEDLLFLSPLYNKLREQRILEAARSVLFANKTANIVIFHLNKQAAFVNRLHFCEPEGESPLGPITVIVESKRIEAFIDWLTPQTVDGKPVNQDKEYPSLEDL
jgi:predicted RNA binding protein with dsRBD fold (UPF0201 family)